MRRHHCYLSTTTQLFAMLTAAVEPILEAISIGRTDIIKKLLEEVEAEIKKSNKFDNDQERGKISCDLSE